LAGLLGWAISPSQGRYLHKRTQTQKKRGQTSIPRVGFEPMIPAFERVKAFNGLDREATVIGAVSYDSPKYSSTSIFWNTEACSVVKFNRRLGRTYLYVLDHLLAACFMLVSCLSYSSTLKMEATYFSETSVNFYRTILHYIVVDKIVHSHRCENLISYDS
jgi:hypothetical protein